MRIKTIYVYIHQHSYHRKITLSDRVTKTTHVHYLRYYLSIKTTLKHIQSCLAPYCTTLFSGLPAAAPPLTGC